MQIGISTSLSASLRYAVSVGALLDMDIIWCSSCYGHHLVQFLLWTAFGALLALASGKAERRQVHPLKVHPLNAKEVYQQC